jgi:methionyl-tRNA formyltransferase
MVAGPPLAIVFFGTPAFAAPTLQALLHSRHRVVGVVSQPDRPRGRGQKPGIAPVKELALRAGLPVLQPERLKDPAFLEAFAALGADIGVVAAYGRIIPEVVINTPRLGLINVHGSLLPRYRGAAPIQRAVMAGDAETGITIMRIVKELDAGAMFAKAVRPIPLEATSGDMERELAAVGAHLLVEVVDAIAAGTAQEEEQDAAQATYAPKITRDESAIDWTRSASAIHNQVRGLNPWPRASTTLDGARLIVIRTWPEDARVSPGTEVPAPRSTQAGSRLQAPGSRLQAPGSEASLTQHPPGADKARSPERGARGVDLSSVEPGLQSRRLAASQGRPGRWTLEPGAEPGTVIDATGEAIRVATGDGVIRVLALQPEGKRAMTAREFLAGRPIPAGARFS